jgi:hypothetical protein
MFQFSEKENSTKCAMMYVRLYTCGSTAHNIAFSAVPTNSCFEALLPQTANFVGTVSAKGEIQET